MRNLDTQATMPVMQPETSLKYGEAVRLYATTDQPGKEIAKLCGVSATGLRAHLYRHHRHLVLARYGFCTGSEAADAVKMRPKKGQTVQAHRKYRDAIAACDNFDYIGYNVTQVANEFGLNGTGLANQLRRHYPEILERREKARMRLGLNDNQQRGVRPWCVEQYAKAVELYRTTDMTLPQVAEACRVSLGGLSQHLRFYHQALIDRKGHDRERAKTHRRRGGMSGNGQIYEPSDAVVAKYSRALELYRTTDMIVKDIARETGVVLESFRNYLRRWHPNLILERRGVRCENYQGEEIDLSRTKRYLKSTAGKYAKAIESLKANPRPTAQVAAEYGFQPEVFRDYLHTHEPELAAGLGMPRLPNGRLVSRRSAEKYAEAVRLYETTTESLKSIARRLGLVYNSVGGFVRRSCPEAIERHEALVARMEKENKP